MRRVHALALFILLASAGCGGPSSPSVPGPDAGVLLRLDPPLGQVSQYSMVSETVMELEGLAMMGSGMEFTQTMFITQEVVEKEGDLLTLTYTIDSLDVDAPGMMASLGSMMDQVVGVSASMVMTNRGEFESTDVVEETLPAGMESAFKAMHEGMKGLSLGFPEGPVEPAETWTVPVSAVIPFGGMGEMLQEGQMVFTLDATEVRDDGRYALMSFHGTQNQTMGSDPSAPVAIGMDATGEATGSVEVSLDEGRITNMTMVMTMSGVMSMMGNDVPLESSVTVTQTLVGR